MRALMLTLTIGTVVTLGATACGIPLAEVDADVDEVCLADSNVQVPASVAGDPSAPVAQTFVIDDLSSVHQLLDYDAKLTFVRAELRTSTPDVLAGIESATVGLAGENLPHAIVYACDGDCDATAASLDLPAQTVDDALAYLSADKLAVDLSAVGSLPAFAWSADVDVCVSGHAHYAYTP